jgi:hypothetical protein
LTLTATVAAEATISSVTAGPYASQGFLRYVDQFSGAQNAYGMRFSGVTGSTTAFLSKFGGATVMTSGSPPGSQVGTTGTILPAYVNPSTGQVEIKASTKFGLTVDPDQAAFYDIGADSSSVTLQIRAKRTAVKPNYSKNYSLRLKTVNPKANSRPIAKIVTIVKTASATATVTTDVAHGLVTGNYVQIYGVRDQTNFATLTTPTTITVLTSTTFTVVMALSTTATSFGGMVTMANGGLGLQGVQTQVIQTIARDAAGVVTAVAGGSWLTGAGVLNVGDYVQAYGLRDNATGADLGFDGAYEVSAVATTTLTLVPIVDLYGVSQSPTGGVVTTTNCGGAIIHRTTFRAHDITLASYGQTVVSIDGAGTSRADKSLPINIVSGTVTTVSTVSTVTAANLNFPTIVADITSVALTSSSTTSGFVPGFGVSYQVNIPVTAVSGTNPTMDVSIEESDDTSTNWYKVYDFPRITATGIYRSPHIPFFGNRIRYVQTVTGTTPSFTRAVNRLQSNYPALPVRQLIDRTIVLTTLNSVTPTILARDCGNSTQLIINVGAITTTAPAIQLEGSDDFGITWYAIGTPLTAVASSTVQITISSINAAALRARVSTAGVGVTAGYVMIKAHD